MKTYKELEIEVLENNSSIPASKVKYEVIVKSSTKIFTKVSSSISIETSQSKSFESNLSPKPPEQNLPTLYSTETFKPNPHSNLYD